MIFNSALGVKRSENFDKFIFISLVIFLSTFVFEGPIRFGLSKVGLSSILYLRDLSEVFSVLLIFSEKILKKNTIDENIAIVFAIIFFHFTIALLFNAPIFQAFFGIKIYLPIIYGVAIWPIVREKFNTLMYVFVFFFIASVIGIYINKYYGEYPWEGETFDSIFGAVSGTRQWWTEGERRLPGLTRASYVAGLVVGITGLAFLLQTKKIIYLLLISTLAISAIYMTTSKGMVQAFFLMAVWILFINSKFLIPIGKILVITLASIVVFLPLIVVYFDIGNEVHLRDVPPIFLSLWDRFDFMWPRAFNLLYGGLNYLIGNGLGAIGIPFQFYASAEKINSADNIFVYLFVNFGLLSFIYFTYPLLQVLKPKTYEIKYAWLIGFLIIFFAYGITTSMIEDTFCATIYGLSIGHCLEIRSKYKENRLYE